jgi:hypothetical protein
LIDASQSQKTGWNACTILEIDSKIQNVKSGFIGKYNTPCLALATGDGRAVVLTRSKGHWESKEAFHTPAGLYSIAIGDADSESPGHELLVSDSAGQLYRIYSKGENEFMAREAVHVGVPADDMVIYDLDPLAPGEEILLLMDDGRAMILYQEHEDPTRCYREEIVAREEYRLRNAVVGPLGPHGQPCAVYVGYSGKVTRIIKNKGTWDLKVIHENPVPLARIALGSREPSSNAYQFYIADDAGSVICLDPDSGGYHASLVCKEDRPLRGLAVENFYPHSPGLEIATFGYGMEVNLYSYPKGKIHGEILYRDSDRGHWLTATRIHNNPHTSALVAAGYSGKVTLISFE